MAGNTARPGTSLVLRTLDVLGSFDQQHRRLTLSAMAERADLPVPTALRIVRHLVQREALMRLEDGSYVVGRRLWELGLLAPVQSDLREVASPFMYDLHAATRATVHLAVRDDDAVLYLDRVSGGTSVSVVSRVGSRLPLHATGVGKVLLAHAPDELLPRLLPLRRVTAFTVNSPGLLARQLDRVRRDGFATTSEEMTLGACSVAVPVTSHDGQVAAALGVVVLHLRRDRPRLVAALTVAAEGIGRHLRLAHDRAV